MGLNNYPYTNFHELNADWIISKIKELAAEYVELEGSFAGLKTYVKNYFANLDLTTELENIVTDLITDGYIESIVSELVSVTEYDKLFDQITTAQTIGCIGDSITYGHSSSVEQVDDPYPEILGTWLANYKAGTIVNNYGVSGAQSTEYLTQFNQAVNDQCDVVIFMFGHNDLRLNNGIDQIIGSAKGFITNCKSHNIVPVICSIPIYYGSTQTRIDGGKLLADALKTLCDQFGAIYVPMFEETSKILNCGMYPISGINDPLLPDGVHWESYYIIASVIMGHVFTMYIANTENDMFPSWRAPGITYNGASLPTVDYSENGRVLTLTSSSAYRFGFYSNRPFKIQTLSHDNVQGPLITWAVTGETSHNYTFDYYQNTASATTYQAQIHNINTDYLPPGYYTVNLSSLTRGQTPQVNTPTFRLSSINIEKTDKVLTDFISNN